MEDAMAPPAKRRKVQEDVLELLDDSTSESTASFFHGVEHIRSPPSARPHKLPQRVEEVHLEIRKQPVMGADERAWLQRRQGTAAASDASSTGADVIVSVVASVDAFGSTTAATTAAVTVDLPNLPVFPSTSTTTVVVSDGSSSTSSGSASSTSASDGSSASASSTDGASSTGSSTSLSASQSTASSTSSSFVPSTTGSEGFIGASAGVASASSSASATFSGSSASNSSSTASPSSRIIAGTVDGYTASTNFPTMSSGQNFTTSATTISASGSTFTSGATLDLASLSSTRSGSQSTQSSSSFLGAVVYIATLQDGRLATITRSSQSYTTTLPDGSTSAIAPYPSSDASRVTSTTLSDGSVSVLSNIQSTVQSTVYSTTTPSTGATTSPPPDGVGAAGAGGSATTSSASSTSSAGSGGGGGSSEPAPAGTIAGGVVGGAAGLALVLVAAMLFLRWYRRKAGTGHRALPASSAAMSPDLDQAPMSRGGPGMAERAGLMPFVAAVPGLFRHQNRSQASDSGAGTGERGFQRVSGRKLPSQFSEGMTGPPRDITSPPPTMPLVGATHRNMSNTSFYRDSQGFYGGEGQPRAGSPNPFSDLTPIDTDASEEKARAGEPIMSPGPQRRPTVHQGGPYVMSPTTASSDTRGQLSPGSPPWTAGTTATFSRSETPASLEGSRGSRFMEEV